MVKLNIIFVRFSGRFSFQGRLNGPFAILMEILNVLLNDKNPKVSRNCFMFSSQPLFSTSPFSSAVERQAVKLSLKMGTFWVS
jgi:hypothetical protein